MRSSYLKPVISTLYCYSISIFPYTQAAIFRYIIELDYHLGYTQGNSEKLLICLYVEVYLLPATPAFRNFRD